MNAYADQREQVCGMTFISCGHIFAKHGREIYRPNGRKDWLLFYIAKESETFYLDGIKMGKSGSFVLFAPGEKQHHIYNGNKTAEFYYVHFSCSSLPADIALNTSTLYDLPLNRKVCDIFEELIDETTRKQPFFEKLCIYKLLSLLTLLDRAIAYDNHPERENLERIAKSVQHMNRDYNSNFTLQDYANLCSMSKYHFLRVFERIVGSTPLEYRNSIRMQHAVDLLLEKKLSVEEISNMVGYSSAAYFSSAFKQKYGLSPKQYQKQALCNSNTKAR